jgi:hypothetical protein
VTLDEARLLQREFQLDLERWMGPTGHDPIRLSWKEHARHAFQWSLFYLMPDIGIHSRALPSCVECHEPFTPRRKTKTQTTCSRKCYDRLLRKAKTPGNPAPHVTRTGRYQKRAESLK